MHVFCTQTQPWTLLSSRLLARRATSLTFSLDEATVLVADKSGDVYSFPTLTQDSPQSQVGEKVKVKDGGEVKNGDEAKGGDHQHQVTEEGEVKSGGEVKDEAEDGKAGKTEGQLVLGHLSMVLDVCLAEEDRYLVTCDRDEKIRISRFPNGYNIHAYCLGHTQFVSCLLYVEELRVLISGSGDASIAAWDMQGKQLCRRSLPQVGKPGPTTARQESSPSPSLSLPAPKKWEGAGDGEGKEEEKEEQEEKEEEEEGERRAVRQLAYCKQYGLLFVSLYSEPRVEVFRLTATTTTTPTPTLTHLQTLSLSHAPWDIAWDDREGVLWVLSPVEGVTLTAFQIQKGGEMEEKEEEEDRVEDVQMVEVGENNKRIVDALRTVNGQWEFFTESLNVPSELPGLWKTHFQDNVLMYQQRKQQRLQAHQQHQQQGQRQGSGRGDGGKNRKKNKRTRTGTTKGDGKEEEEVAASTTTIVGGTGSGSRQQDQDQEGDREGLRGKKARESS